MASPSNIELTPEITEAVNNAQPSGKALSVAYVTADGRPRLSLRGSTHVHGPDELAIWVRQAEGGLVEAVQANPNISLLYRDAPARTTYIFSGRARVATDEATRGKVFDDSPAFEREHDPERKGVAVVIELDEVKGGTVGGTQVSMTRS